MLMKDCEKHVDDVGVLMMGTPTSFSEERTIELISIGGESSGEMISNGTSVSALWSSPQSTIKRSFLVKLSPKTNQCMFEVRGKGASFPRGGCGFTRALCENTRGAMLELESVGDGVGEDISITAAWGTSFQGGVRISAPYLLSGRLEEGKGDALLPEL
jgi:hypothetical protein